MTKLDTESKLEIIQKAIDDIKAEDVSIIDLRDKTIMMDYFVLATGTSNVHIRSIVDKILEKMKAQGERADRIEGYAEGQWVLVDYGDIVVHVFAQEIREFYDLESLWQATTERLAPR
jgi:ribosome-associated protein